MKMTGVGGGLEQGEAGKTTGQLSQLSWGRYWVSEPGQGSGEVAAFFVHLPLKRPDPAHPEQSTASVPGSALPPDTPITENNLTGLPVA